MLRFDRGEEIISSFKTFCEQENIISGFFYGLGACKNLKLAYYDIEEKKYLDKEYPEDMEIANLTGNISQSDLGLVIHTHGTFSGKDFAAIAGHVVSAEVAVTCEIFLIKFEGPLARELDLKTGLKLLD